MLLVHNPSTVLLYPWPPFPLEDGQTARALSLSRLPKWYLNDDNAGSDAPSHARVHLLIFARIYTPNPPTIEYAQA